MDLVGQFGDVDLQVAEKVGGLHEQGRRLRAQVFGQNGGFRRPPVGVGTRTTRAPEWAK